MLELLVTYIGKKKEIGFLPHTTYKNQFQVDVKLKYER